MFKRFKPLACLDLGFNMFQYFSIMAVLADSPQAWSTSFWMGAFAGPTPKRHRLWSNCEQFLAGIHQVGGKMTREALKALPGGPLVRKYVDRHGVKRCTGLKEKLKQSQYLWLHYVSYIKARKDAT